ncbi:Putative coat protein [Salinibacillus kushneri]|uniref:Putative coat protein n=1 Tax=Salinibacillus kushneri TaxID=237682 RepID=A0A1I0HPH7_9BACI|nr:spore coat protein YlbD [Salinibacillus kushneri]SET85985.1 Putative coat protein [Salinibacillus kushneri]
MSSLHPKVEQFKSFVEKHPKLIEHVRTQKGSWQTYYEKWLLYGEEDAYWNQFKDEGTKASSKEKQVKNQELFSKLSNMMNNMDLNKLQDQMNQLSGVISNVQGLIQQFQQQNSGSSWSQNRPDPFKFGKD